MYAAKPGNGSAGAQDQNGKSGTVKGFFVAFSPVYLLFARKSGRVYT